MKTIGALACTLLCLLGVAGCANSGPPLPLASHVDLQRYSGRWYIIANIPYFAERGKVGSYLTESFPDGKVLDVYTGRKDFSSPPSNFTLHGVIVPNTGNAQWRESPFWPLYFSYLILYVDPDYRTALLGYPGRGYGWVIARSPVMDDATYQSLLGRMAADGYDISQFRRVPQEPGEVGKAGFQ